MKCLIEFFLTIRNRKVASAGGMAEFVKTTGKNIPDTAVRAGYEYDGKALFLARCKINGEVVFGKAAFHLPGGHFPYGGKEHILNEYDIMIHPASAPGFYSWKSAANGEVPPDPVSKDGDDLYIGRCEFKGGLHPGKVKASHGCAYVSYAGVEYSVKEYEVLCKIK